MIGGARYLNKARAARQSQQATAVVVSVMPSDVPILRPALLLFSKHLKVEKATQANHYTQYTNWYQFEHSFPRCTHKHPTGPFCAVYHTSSAHRCQNPTCPKGEQPKPSLAAAPPPIPTTPTVLMTMMACIRNAGLDESLLLEPRPSYQSSTTHLTPSQRVRKPWM